MLLASSELSPHTYAGIPRDSWSAGFAAPSGRTLATGGWGCTLSLVAAQAFAFDLPSGQPIEFHESFYERQDDGALWARFRFVMPGLAEGLSYADVADDFLTICQVYVIPALDGQDQPDQIVISLAERKTAFGVAAPDVQQFFEAFRLDGDLCLWEPL